MDGPGELTTRPLTCQGRHLFVNVKGELRVEVLDEAGKVLRTSRTISGDHTKIHLAWNDGADLSALAGKPVKLHFELTQGSLYAFWITDDAHGASHGYIGAGGPGFKGVRDE
jgi:hypothetical protein